jgi:CBS domain-containing protein
MAQSVRDVMTSNPRTIDADQSVAYAAKMMQEEDVGLAPIVEGDRLVGMLTDRDIALRVAAEGRDPDQVNVLDVASKNLVTIDLRQDLDEVLRIMAQHQVRRLPVVEEGGRLIGVVAQADIAREGDDATTGQLVQEISDSGGQMSSMEEQEFGQMGVQPEPVEAPVEPEAEKQEEEEVSRVQAASARPRRRSTRKRTTTARKRSTSKRSTAKRGTAKRKTASRKRSTAKRGTAKRKTASRKRSTAKRGTAKRGTAKRKTASRKRSTAKRGTAKRSTAKRSTAKRGTAKRRTTRRRTTR